MQRVAIRLRIDGNGAQTYGSGGTDYAARNLAAIGDQKRAETAIMRTPRHDHILNSPNVVGSIGAFAAADNPSPSTRRVSAGSITPSSHSRAVA
jgi:hypothetical protein